MKFLANLATFGSLTVALVACSSSTPANNSRAASATPAAATATSPIATAPQPVASANAAGTSCVTPAASLALTATVGYTDTVQAILTKDCATCHMTGGQAPDLSTFAAASAAAAASLTAVTNGTMPPSGTTLAPADEANFAEWVNGGAPETGTGAASGSTAAPTTASTASTVVCPTTTAATTATAATSGTVATQAASGSVAIGDTSGTTAMASGTTANATGTTTTTTTMTVTYSNTIMQLMSGYCTGCHGNNGTSPNLTTYADVKAAAAKSLADMMNGKMPKGGTKLSATDITEFSDWINNKEPQ